VGAAVGVGAGLVRSRARNTQLNVKRWMRHALPNKGLHPTPVNLAYTQRRSLR